eukprot:TRINITY_DN273_c0_g2_i2.p1 TRINITY_DN273_c0_g2~~TRINITY_DN273_c0_g2_i2.p1  ORF type:complete len:230 (+),score=25.01 TRINITY_DN273_c0_g2_i2:124-813(+)
MQDDAPSPSAAKKTSSRREKKNACPGCEGRAANWSRDETRRLIEVLDDGLPQLKKSTKAWEEAAEQINKWRAEARCGGPRCVHQIIKYSRRLEVDYRKAARPQTGGKDLPWWYKEFARMKDKEISSAVAGGGSISDNDEERPEGGEDEAAAAPAAAAAAAAGEKRADAMRRAADERRARVRHRQLLVDEALTTMVAANRAAKTAKVTVKLCRRCGGVDTARASVSGKPG